MNAEKYGEKYNAFRNGSAARSRVTTRVHSARRSPREPASIPARTSGREQPSGAGPGSTPCPNRGVAHAPNDFPGCERRAADGTKRRPQKGSSCSPEVAGAVTDPTTGLRCCRRGCSAEWSALPLGFRRQPLRFVAAPLAASTGQIGIRKPARKDGPEIHQVWFQNSGRNSRDALVGLMAPTGRRRPRSVA